MKISIKKSGIAIHYSKNQVFWSCAEGGDLNDFDLLICACLPDVDLNKMTAQQARMLEITLYQILSATKKPHRTLEAFAVFISVLEKRFCSRSIRTGAQALICDTQLFSLNALFTHALFKTSSKEKGVLV